MRLLGEGRLSIDEVNPETLFVLATVRGDHDEYRLGFDPQRREWRCTCPGSRTYFRRRDCSHLVALKLVTGERTTNDD